MTTLKINLPLIGDEKVGFEKIYAESAIFRNDMAVKDNNDETLLRVGQGFSPALSIADEHTQRKTSVRIDWDTGKHTHSKKHLFGTVNNIRDKPTRTTIRNPVADDAHYNSDYEPGADSYDHHYLAPQTKIVYMTYDELKDTVDNDNQKYFYIYPSQCMYCGKQHNIHENGKMYCDKSINKINKEKAKAKNKDNSDDLKFTKDIDLIEVLRVPIYSLYGIARVENLNYRDYYKSVDSLARTMGPYSTFCDYEFVDDSFNKAHQSMLHPMDIGANHTSRLTTQNLFFREPEFYKTEKDVEEEEEGMFTTGNIKRCHVRKMNKYLIKLRDKKMKEQGISNSELLGELTEEEMDDIYEEHLRIFSKPLFPDGEFLLPAILQGGRENNTTLDAMQAVFIYYERRILDPIINTKEKVQRARAQHDIWQEQQFVDPEGDVALLKPYGKSKDEKCQRVPLCESFTQPDYDDFKTITVHYDEHFHDKKLYEPAKTFNDPSFFRGSDTAVFKYNESNEYALNMIEVCNDFGLGQLRHRLERTLDRLYEVKDSYSLRLDGKMMHNQYFYIQDDIEECFNLQYSDCDLNVYYPPFYFASSGKVHEKTTLTGHLLDYRAPKPDARTIKAYVEKHIKPKHRQCAQSDKEFYRIAMHYEAARFLEMAPKCRYLTWTAYTPHYNGEKRDIYVTHREAERAECTDEAEDGNNIKAASARKVKQSVHDLNIKLIENEDYVYFYDPSLLATYRDIVTSTSEFMMASKNPIGEYCKKIKIKGY
jgi:hypothetical protein